MSRSRPEVVDHDGARHRHGCPCPGWDAPPPTAASIRVLRCAGCGAVRLEVAPPPPPALRIPPRPPAPRRHR